MNDAWLFIGIGLVIGFLIGHLFGYTDGYKDGEAFTKDPTHTYTRPV
jgi:hypothetical protein